MKKGQKKQKIKNKVRLAKLYKETNDLAKVREEAGDEKLSRRKSKNERQIYQKWQSCRFISKGIEVLYIRKEIQNMKILRHFFIIE